MPAKYEAIRNQLFEKKKAEWKKRHPDKALSSAVKRELYDQSQSSAAKLTRFDKPDISSAAP